MAFSVGEAEGHLIWGLREAEIRKNPGAAGDVACVSFSVHQLGPGRGSVTIVGQLPYAWQLNVKCERVRFSARSGRLDGV